LQILFLDTWLLSADGSRPFREMTLAIGLYSRCSLWEVSLAAFPSPSFFNTARCSRKDKSGFSLTASATAPLEWLYGSPDNFLFFYSIASPGSLSSFPYRGVIVARRLFLVKLIKTRVRFHSNKGVSFLSRLIHSRPYSLFLLFWNAFSSLEALPVRFKILRLRPFSSHFFGPSRDCFCLDFFLYQILPTVTGEIPRGSNVPPKYLFSLT